MKILILSLVMIRALTSIGCAKSQGDDRLRERAAIEGKGDQDAIDNKAREMEARLARMQRFFQGVAGTFEGKMRIASSGSVYDVRFVITPSIDVYTGERTRSMDEITYDLTNLTLNIEQTTTTKLRSGEVFASGCNYAELKPKTDNGFILARDEVCPMTFTMSLESAGVDGRDVKETREKASQALLNGEIDSIENFKIEMRSIHKPGVEVYDVVRTGR